MDHVALLAEGVDRNEDTNPTDADADVALLAEGVDRNADVLNWGTQEGGRPPRGGRG